MQSAALNTGLLDFNRRGRLSDHVGTASSLERQASLWVGQTFFGTLLKQMRESPFRSGLFDGGRGGQAFGSLYDQQLAQRMSHGVGRKLVHAIVRKFDAKRAYERQRSQGQK